MPAPDPLARLVEAAIEGDDAAAAALVRATQPELWRVCAALGSAGEVEDLVQETYERALRALPGFRGDAPVRMWLLTIARRVCADHVRRRQRQRRLVSRIIQLSSPAVVAPVEVGDDVLDVLVPDRRDAFVLTQMVGLSYDEAAVVLECPVGTIRSRVSRARQDLLSALQESPAQSWTGNRTV